MAQYSSQQQPLPGFLALQCRKSRPSLKRIENETWLPALPVPRVWGLSRRTVNGAIFGQVLARHSKLSLCFLSTDVVHSTLEGKDQQGCDMNVDS